MSFRGITGWKLAADGTLVYESNGLPVLMTIVVGPTARTFKLVEKK